jgi:hypothetical protein
MAPENSLFLRLGVVVTFMPTGQIYVYFYFYFQFCNFITLVIIHKEI